MNLTFQGHTCQKGRNEFFDSHEKFVSMLWSVLDFKVKAGWPGGQLIGQQIFRMWRNFSVVIFFDTINMITVKVCMMVALIKLYPFIPLSVTLIVFQGHNSGKQF